MGPPDVIFAVGAVAADAPPATANDAPAAPRKGKAVFRRFLFEACLACAMLDPPMRTRTCSMSGPIFVALFARPAQAAFKDDQGELSCVPATPPAATDLVAWQG